MIKKINWKHQVFIDIAEKNWYVSEISDQSISTNCIAPINYHHILPKRDYKEFWYEPDNIIFCTADEHQELHNMTRDNIEKYAKSLRKALYLFERYKQSGGRNPMPKYLTFIDL